MLLLQLNKSPFLFVFQPNHHNHNNSHEHDSGHYDHNVEGGAVAETVLGLILTSGTGKFAAQTFPVGRVITLRAAALPFWVIESSIGAHAVHVDQDEIIRGAVGGVNHVQAGRICRDVQRVILGESQAVDRRLLANLKYAYCFGGDRVVDEGQFVVGCVGEVLALLRDGVWLDRWVCGRVEYLRGRRRNIEILVE